MKLYTEYYQKDLMKMNEQLIHECLVHADGTQYKKELIEILMDKMPAGFATDVAKCVYEVSGINTDKASSEELERFLEKTSGL